MVAMDIGGDGGGGSSGIVDIFSILFTFVVLLSYVG